MSNDKRDIIELTSKEYLQYKAVMKYLKTHHNIARLAAELKYTKQTAWAYIRGYKEQGKAFFISGHRGIIPKTRMPDETREKVLDLFQGKYKGSSYRHFKELLDKYEGIHYSAECLRGLLLKHGLLSPLSVKKTKKMIKKLKAEQAKESQIEGSIESSIENDSDTNVLNKNKAHPRRPRKRYSGELIQIDASTHCWFGDGKSSLHIAVDDATSKIMAGFFDTQETLYGYFKTLKEVLLKYGVPSTILSDKRTVFTSKSSEDVRDRPTQFGYACNNLGICLKTTSIPQTKGRVERAFGTLQKRLPMELKFAGISTIDQANNFLEKFFVDYNEKFAIESTEKDNAFIPPPTADEIALILSTHYERTVRGGGTINFECNEYVVLDSKANIINFRKGVKGNVTKTLDGKLYFNIANETYALEKRVLVEPYSKEFDTEIIEPERSEIKIPKNMHIWKSTVFKSYVNRHRSDH
ncbi:MAG: ISNCY family transposase [Christensenellaceae bacterium]|nr:ISNCY family transposase [Christensenellaceae bacterium]